MRRLIALGFIYILPILSIWAQVDIGLPFVKYYSTRDYKAGIQNWHIAQDSRGVIYVANNFGLLEYDGSSWAIHPVATGVKIRHLNFTPDKKIAIASQGEFGYFMSDNLGQWIYSSISDQLSANDRNFEETWKTFHIDGKDYFCTTYKIFIVDNGKIDIINSEALMESFFLVNEKLYIHKPSVGLEVIQKDTLQPVNSQPFLLRTSIASIIPLSNNKMMIVTKQNGAYLLDENSYKIWRPEHQQVLAQSIVNTAIRLHNGDIAFGTQNNGLLVYSIEGELKNHLTKDLGINSRTIICLFEDKQNNLWAGHNNGLSYIEFGQPFSFINEHNGLPGTGYHGIQDNGTLYLATNNGLYKSNESQANLDEKFSLVDKSEGQVYRIQKSENLFLVGHHNGAYVFDSQTAFRQIGELGTWLYLRLPSHPDYLIAGTYTGLDLYQNVNGSLTHKWKLDGFDESCRIMEQDDKLTFWMTHGYKGVYRFHLSDNLKSVEDVQFYGTESGLPNNILINVYRIRGSLCFTTTDGVYKYEKQTDRFQKDPFFTKFFEPGTPINILAEDARQNIYFIGQSEIGVLRKDASGEYYKETNAFNKIKGMLNDDLQSISILEDDKVLYAAQEGFIVYDANKDILVNNDFEILIRRVTLSDAVDSVIYYGNIPSHNNSSVSPKTEPDVLPSSFNSLQFQYSATYMDGLELTTYQYLLDGFESEWSGWDNEVEKEYTNLYEGEYTFKVRAKNLFGQVSKEASYTFVILPPWYRTRIAYISYFILFAISIMALAGFITRRHRQEKNKLLNTQKHELSKRDYELESIKTESEKEIERLKTEKLKIDIQHKNKELAAATMHMITKNEFITHVKQSLNSMVRNHPKDPLTARLKKILASIDKNVTDDDWQHFEIYFDQVHGDFSERLKQKFPKLSPQDRRLCTYLRMNMTTKEIANLLNISVRGTEISRYRLRKKLDLSRDTNLAEFILNF